MIVATARTAGLSSGPRVEQTHASANAPSAKLHQLFHNDRCAYTREADDLEWL